MAGNNLNWLEMSENLWKLLDMAGKDLKLPKMAVSGRKWLTITDNF